MLLVSSAFIDSDFIYSDEFRAVAGAPPPRRHPSPAHHRQALCMEIRETDRVLAGALQSDGAAMVTFPKIRARDKAWVEIVEEIAGWRSSLCKPSPASGGIGERRVGR